MNKLLLLIFLLPLTYSCGNYSKSSESEVIKIIKDKYQLNMNYNHILFLNEYGCPSCDKEFAKFIMNCTKNAKVLIVISNKGTNIDLSLLYDEKSPNIIFDYHNYLSKSKLIGNNSAYLRFSGDIIDTIITLTPSNLGASLSYIENNIAHN